MIPGPPQPGHRAGRRLPRARRPPRGSPAGLAPLSPLAGLDNLEVLHLDARLNFYRLFNEAIEKFSLAEVARRQLAALKKVGLAEAAGA